MPKPIHFITLAILVIPSVLGYLQLKLARNELRESLKNQSVKCITKQIDKQLDEERKKEKQQKKQKKKSKKDKDQEDEEDEDDQEQEQIDDDKIEQKKNYKEICYEKDISYSLPIYLNDKLNMISLDTTVPISWFKGPNCHLEASSKKCSPLVANIREKIKTVFKKKEAKPHHVDSDYAIIEGSSELVKGIQQTSNNFGFVTRDSSRLTNLMQLLLLGFYMKGQKDNVALQSTNFINATQISQNLNYLCDGAISMRFDEMSQCSFLKQLLDYQKINDKYVSIYSDKYGSALVAIGEVASKYSKNGYGGLQWVDIKDDQNYGKLPVITDVVIENEGNHKFSQIRQKQYPAVISLSASYIGIPKQLMSEWLAKFNKKSNCSINEVTKYLECKSFKQKQESKIITFQFSGKKISFKLSELILGKKKGKTLFNMKQTLHDTYAILGEPLFLKYLVVFDYNKNKVGLGEKADGTQKQIINVVSLVRFICFVFFFGCSFILCFLPIKRCFELIKSKTKYGITSQNKGETRRLKQYSPIQQNPYQDLSGRVKQVFGEDN